MHYSLQLKSGFLGVRVEAIIDNQQELVRWVCAQRERLDLAVAFWGEGAIEQLQLRKTRPFRVLLDLTAGGTNPAEVRRLLRLGKRRVRHVPRLHAKAYLGDSSLIVGSANASSNGLGAEGFEATHWRELSLLTDGKKAVVDAIAWFNRQWLNSGEISEADLVLAEAAWTKRRRARPAPFGGTLLGVAHERPLELLGRRIFVNVVTQRMDPDDEAELEQMGEDRGMKLFGFTYFPDIPIAATMISFTEYPGRQLCRDVPFVSFTPAERRRGKFKLVTRGDLGGYEFPRDEISEMKRRIRFFRDNHKKSWKANGGMLMEITEFMRETSPAVA